MQSKEQILQELIEQFHRRKALGEAPDPAEFREAAGVHYDAFVRFVELDSFIHRVTAGEPPEHFPRQFGEFTILSVLGEGGVGRVYRAVQRKLSRPVALKILRGDWGADTSLRERFRRGAKAAAQVEHDHVVRIYDHGFFNDRPYVAMSLLDGPPLDRTLAELRRAGSPPFGEKHAAELENAGVPPGDGYLGRTAVLVAGVADALAEYHALGIVHRDVKPGNLMLDKQGRLVLTDFDLAKGLETNFRTQYGASLGTPAYMSPEQRDPTANVDGRADIYALGGVLFELWTLRRPHEDHNDPTRVRAGSPTEAGPHIPAPAARILRKCLEPAPEDRYVDARALAADLRAFAEGGEVKARAVPATRKAARWLSTRKFAAALVVGVASIGGYFGLRPAIVDIQSTPVGATLYLEGKRAGTTPTQISVAPGSYRLDLKKSGYVPWNLTPDVLGGTTIFTVDLERVIHRAERERDKSDSVVLPPSFQTRGDEPAIAVLPRGKIQPGDVRFFVQGLDPASVLMIDERGVEWRGNSDDPLPSLRVGGHYRWRIANSDWARFEVIASLEIENRDFPEKDRALLIAAYYQSFGLHRAAILKLKANRPAGDTQRWARLFWRSITTLGLTETTLAADVLAAVISKSDASRALHGTWSGEAGRTGAVAQIMRDPTNWTFDNTGRFEFTGVLHVHMPGSNAIRATAKATGTYRVDDNSLVLAIATVVKNIRPGAVDHWRALRQGTARFTVRIDGSTLTLAGPEWGKGEFDR